MSETSKRGYFVLTIAKEDGENGFVLGQELSSLIDDAYGSRLLHTRYYPHDPMGQACWTCGGDPDSHPSGIKCICGDGTHTSEVVNLRKLADAPTPPRTYSADDVLRTIQKFNSTEKRFLDEWSGIWESSGPASQAATPPEGSRTKGEKSMSYDYKSATFHIAIDVSHPEALDPGEIFAQIFMNWEALDIAQKLENDGIVLDPRWYPGAYQKGGEWKEGREQEHTKEGSVQTEQDVDLATEQWSPQYLRGYLIDIFKLPAVSDNWTILDKVRLEGQHWRSAIHEIQDMLGIRGDGPTTVDAVKKRIYGTPSLEQQLQSLERENARLHGVIEGMGKR